MEAMRIMTLSNPNSIQVNRGWVFLSLWILYSCVWQVCGFQTLYAGDSVFHQSLQTQPGTSSTDTGDQNSSEHPATSLPFFLSDAEEEEVLPAEPSFGVDFTVVPIIHRGLVREMPPSGFSPEQIPPPPRA